MRNPILILLLTLAFATCTNKGVKQQTQSETIGKDQNRLSNLMSRYFNDRMKLYPFEATQNGISGYNQLFPNDISDTYRQTLKSFYEKYTLELSQQDTTKITSNDRISYDILKWELQQNLAAFQFHDNYMPINQFTSKTLELGQLGSGAGVQPFKTKDDYINWLQRMHAFPAWTDTAIANMRKGVQIGWVLPKSLALKVLPQLESMITDDPAKNLFYGPVTQLDTNTQIVWETKKELKQSYTEAIKEDIIASYQKLYFFFKNEYLPHCRTTSGIGALPGGKEYYQQLIKTWTTTDMTADEIFEVGKKEVARIRGEMEIVKQQVGFKGDLKSFFAYVNTNKQLFPFKTPDEVLASFYNIRTKMAPQLSKQFDLVPKTGFEVRRTETFREASASAEYNQGSPDGTRPGVFYFPIIGGDATKINCFQDEALFLHEAIPGHHYQMSLQQENTKLPEFRRFLWYGAFGEGYALYTESLGKELGLYTDPYQYFGRLGMEMHRAIRLVVDVGLHAKGWTREQAIRYDLDNEADSEEGITAEVERYMAIPGQALGYKIGEIKIQTLKKQAQTQLGARFDIRQFHNELLKDGCVPLKVLEEKMTRFQQSTIPN